jgi:hypothetical protein
MKDHNIYVHTESVERIIAVGVWNLTNNRHQTTSQYIPLKLLDLNGGREYAIYLNKNVKFLSPIQ